MKIAFVLDDTLDSSDGVQQYVLLISDWMRRNGHEIHYITGQTTRTDISNIYSMSKNMRVRFNRNRLSVPLPARSSAIKQLLSTHEFDVLHVQMPFSPLMAGKVIKYASSKTAIVATYHIAPHSKLVAAANKMLGTAQLKTIARIDALISVSSVAQDFAKKTTKKSSIVIPNSIDTKLWRSKSHKTRVNDIVFLGRLVSRKGCIYLLRALADLKARDKLGDAKVVIAGDGPERKQLEGFVKANGLSKHTAFVGYISEDQKRDLLQTAKLAVYPATGGESFGIVLLEAMAAGAVVLAGDNPGYTSVIGQAAGSLVAPQNTRRFADQLSELLSNDQKRKQLGKDQQQLLDQYDIDNVGSAILAVYKEANHKRGVKSDV
jgi:phosphatidylinositol alpha-mannosyltransferase